MACDRSIDRRLSPRGPQDVASQVQVRGQGRSIAIFGQRDVIRRSATVFLTSRECSSHQYGPERGAEPPTRQPGRLDAWGARRASGISANAQWPPIVDQAEVGVTVRARGFCEGPAVRVCPHRLLRDIEQAAERGEHPCHRVVGPVSVRRRHLHRGREVDRTGGGSGRYAVICLPYKGLLELLLGTELGRRIN